MKEIIFVTPNLANGGAERVTSVLASELVNAGVRVTLAVMLDSSCTYPVPDSVERVVCYREGGRIGRIAKKILALRKLIKQRKDAVIIAMLPFETIYTHIACLGLKRRVYYSLRNDPSRSYTSRLLKSLVHHAYGSARGIVFQTEDARSFFPEKVRRNGIVIPNPLREDCPQPCSEERTKEIVSVGRLEPQKNYPLLLSAFADVSRLRPDWLLRIYGEGELRAQLEKLAEDLGIRDRTVFMGFCKDVNERIVKSGVFALSSDYEGISNAMLEALAMGIPCVCTDCPIGGARMFIDSGKNGLLVPVGDRAALRQALLRLIDEEELRRSFSLESVKIRDLLSAKSIARRWIEFIDKGQV